MLKIAPSTMQAFEAASARRDVARFGEWWRAQALPGYAPEQLEWLWRHAAEKAEELGIEDDERGQISLCAAAFALLGEMSAEEFVTVADLLFDAGGPDAGLAQLRAMAAHRQGPR